MARTQTMVQLSDELLEVLDRVAAARGASRSALVRELLWEALSEDRDRRIGELIADGYRRAPATSTAIKRPCAASMPRSARPASVRGESR